METQYILSSNGELYHRKDHKYISREWKNGRWVYTYPVGQNYSVVGSKDKVETAYPVGQNYSKIKTDSKFVDYDSTEAAKARDDTKQQIAKEKDDKERMERLIRNAAKWVDDRLPFLGLILNRK